MRVTRVFLDTDMRMSFDGLRKLAEENSAGLNCDSTIMFMNRARTMFKVLRANKYLVAYSNGQRKIPLEAITELPQAFGGTELEMNEAIRKSIMKKLRLDVSNA